MYITPHPTHHTPHQTSHHTPHHTPHPTHPPHPKDTPHTPSQSTSDALEKAQRVRTLLAPFVLRRLKSEVAQQLVPKQHEVIAVDMTPRQAVLYEETKRAFQEEMSGYGFMVGYEIWWCMVVVMYGGGGWCVVLVSWWCEELVGGVVW